MSAISSGLSTTEKNFKGYFDLPNDIFLLKHYQEQYYELYPDFPILASFGLSS